MLEVPRELASVHAAMLMEGTKRKKKAQIQELLDSLGAELSFYASADRLGFFARVPAKNVSKLLALAAEMLSEPTFPKPELDVLKKRSLASLQLAAEDPRTQAGILLSRALFPKGHLNFSETTDESRKAMLVITPAMLRKYHDHTVNAATLIVVGAGDITSDAFSKDVTKAFAKLPRANFRLSEQPVESDYKLSTTSSKLSKTIAGKSSIDYMIGLRLGMTEDHPDYPALLIGLRVLGNPGGFTGRLMQNVREKEGLTYGTYAYLAGLDGGADGYAMAWATFAPQLFKRGRTAVVGEIENILHNGVTESDVRRHAELYAAKSEVRMSDSGAYARAAHEVIAEGRDLSYLDTFPERVRRVTVSDVNAALKKYLKLGLMSEAAAGPVERNALK
jgi:zinc protease